MNQPVVFPNFRLGEQQPATPELSGQQLQGTVHRRLFKVCALYKRPGPVVVLNGGASYDSEIGGNQFLLAGAKKYQFSFLLCSVYLN